ncbi:MAG: hypothetical protein M1817_000959 [Caeruleum heppii]|nr:MAG: hypothetical protein M1817_000959 [Caeruleum heppii]
MLARLATMTAEFEPRLLELEATAPPSQLRPWQFEVVLLPWGRALHGIWCGADQFSTSHSVSLPAMEEWTQEPDVGGSFSKSVSSGAEYGGWDDADIRRWADNTEEWRSARACGPKSKVFRRLSSRGFVRTVQITDGSAATVRAAIVEAFGHLLKPSTKNTYRQGMTDASSRLPAEADRTRVLGLEAPFVPLRKIHKQSRLRHLHISEMMTSALWTADFLASRVVMKGLEGRKTLFITSVDAYLQYDRDEGAGWTWSKLKQLPMVDVESSNNVSKRGEACWDWDQKLDRTTEAEPQSWLDRNLRPAHTLQPEVNSHGEHSSQGLSSLPTSHSLFDPSSSSEPSFGGMHCTHRHASMPHMSVMEETAPSYKRRVASQDTSLPRETSSKRRRVSPSSALDAFQQGIFDTPIPCRDDPPSPFFSEAAPGESRSQGTNPKRAGTPFAYATPHSGTVALERKVSWDQQRGLDSDEEMRLLASNDDDHDWEGVQDESGYGDTAGTAPVDEESDERE